MGFFSPAQFWRSLTGLLILATVPAAAPAQISPDPSLNTQVNRQGATVEITGGTRAGENLFHSFTDFSIPPNGTAFFNHAPDLGNIISRVTGGNLSDIQGTIRSLGQANFFLINPAGIVFGESAALEVGGSFVATTGDRLLFADGFTFEANTTPPSPLLTHSVPVGLQVGMTPGAIINRSRTPNNRGTVGGLQVSPGRDLVLVGGDIQLDGGQLTTPSGTVQLGSLEENSTVFFSHTPLGLTLNYSDGAVFGDITLANRAGIDTSGPRSGAITLQGDRIHLTSGSTILGITTGALDGGAIALAGRQITLDGGSDIVSRTLNSGAGPDINVQGTESVELVGGGYDNALGIIVGLFTSSLNPADLALGLGTSTASSGNSGAITVDTQRLQFSNGATLGTLTLGTGKAGDVILRATESVTASESLLGTTALVGSTGAGGQVTVQTPRLNVRNGTQINSSVLGAGNGSTISIEAETITLLDTRPGLPPLPDSEIVRTSVLTGINNITLGTGAAGDILIQTETLEAIAGSRIQTNTTRDLNPEAGPAGDILINATDRVVLRGTSPVDGLPTIISTLTNTRSPAGSLTLNTGQLILRDGSSLQSDTFGPSDAGPIMVTANHSVDISGSSFSSFLQRQMVSRISSSSLQTPGTSLLEATGSAGQVMVTTPDLRLRDQGTISASSVSRGNAGTLTLKTDRLHLRDQATISGTTAGGNGGQILITARDGITLRDRSEIRSTADPTAVGVGGDIRIDATSLSLTDSGIAGNSRSPAVQGGDIGIRLRGRLQLVRSNIDATTVGGNGGNIGVVGAESIVLRDNSFISTTAGLAGSGGDGGNITLETPLLVAFPTENNDITANAFTGNGGQIQIQTDAILGLQPRSQLTPLSDITASSAFGVSGEVSITEFSIEPDSNLFEAPPPFLDPSQLVILGCSLDSEFVAIGRGGLPGDPNHRVESDRPWDDVRDLSPFRRSRFSLSPGPGDRLPLVSSSSSPSSSSPSPFPLEATGWQPTSTGTIALITSPSSPISEVHSPSTACGQGPSPRPA